MRHMSAHFAGSTESAHQGQNHGRGKIRVASNQPKIECAAAQVGLACSVQRCDGRFGLSDGPNRGFSHDRCKRSLLYRVETRAHTVNFACAGTIPCVCGRFEERPAHIVSRLAEAGSALGGFRCMPLCRRLNSSKFSQDHAPKLSHRWCSVAFSADWSADESEGGRASDLISKQQTQTEGASRRAIVQHSLCYAAGASHLRDEA